MKVFVLITCWLASSFANSKPSVTTSLAPYEYALEKIAQDEIQIHVLVPENANPHIYELKPQDMKKLQASQLWLCSGESIERKLKVPISAKKIDLNQNISLISTHDHDHAHDHHQCCNHTFDLHTWLSPKNYRIQSKTILNALCDTFPDKKEKFEKNFIELEKELIALEHAVNAHQITSSHKKLVVAHAAYAYLCQDLKIDQVSLEYEGKETSLKHIQTIYQQHKDSSIKHVFTEVQHGDAGAKRLASLLNTDVVQVNPYQKNYPQAIQEILKHLP